MKNIKFTSKTSLILDGKAYRGYLLGELPMKFGFLYDSDDDKDGVCSWFNMNGLTWLLK